MENKKQNNTKDVFWREYGEVNIALMKQFVCIPPYLNYAKDFSELKQACEDVNKNILHLVSSRVNNPWQRAYQMEFVLKECRIFKNFIPIIEYATYDAMSENWMCAYVTLVPIVEAVMREWHIEKHGSELGFKPYKISAFEDTPMREGEDGIIERSLVDYLKTILKDIFYLPFSDYEKGKHNYVFNRQLLLHKMLGVTQFEEGMNNLTRIFLVIDVIAELYLLQNPAKRFAMTLNADTENNVDFLLRWELYKKRVMQAVRQNDLLIIYNCFYRNNCDDNKKINTIKRLRYEQAKL